jgi:hypothetical protein
MKNKIINFTIKKVMGRKVKQFKSPEELYDKMSRMLVPENILADFDITDANQLKDIWQIELHEKSNRVPIELQKREDVVFDGFCNPVEMLSHSFVLKPVYLKLYRRRWKLSNSDKHYSNTYDFTLKGLKMVPELGVFLKEEDRRLSD